MVKRDIILLVEGGSMAGVFGGGVLCALDKEEIRSRIHSIYCYSAGAGDAAYFLSGNTSEGIEVYTKELISKRSKFINMDIVELFSNFWKLLLFRKSLHLLDLDVLKEIIKYKKKLNFKNIKNSPIKFYVGVFDRVNMKTRYIDGKQDTLEAISVSAHLPPYIHLNTKSTDLYDGGTIPNDSFLKIAKENKDKTIIWIMNEKRTFATKLKDSIFRVIDLYAQAMYFGFGHMLYYLYHFYDFPVIEAIKRQKHVILVHPDGNVRKITTDRKAIVDLYHQGLKKGKEVLNKLNI